MGLTNSLSEALKAIQKHWNREKYIPESFKSAKKSTFGNLFDESRRNALKRAYHPSKESKNK